MSERRLTGPELRAVAIALHGSAGGATAALADRLGADRRIVRRWMAGAVPIPAGVAKQLEALMGVDDFPPESAWRRDEWIVGDGASDAEGHRREYVIHLWPPRFRCRAVECDPESGLPAPEEEPADVLTGVVYAAGPETVLAEFEWIDRPPRDAQLVRLLEAAADALERSTE